VKRPFGTLLAAMLFVSAGINCVSSAAAQDWPNKPVRIVNTFAPGGAADYLARTIADGLSSTFGQQFFVETRSGAAGAIGVNSVVATPPDGYNFVITNITMLVLAPISNPKLGYHPERDLTNIAYLGGSPVVLSVNAKSPIKSLAEDHGFHLPVETDHDDDEVARVGDGLRRQRGLHTGFGGAFHRTFGDVEAGDGEAALYQMARHRQAHLAEPDQAHAAYVILLCHGISLLAPPAAPHRRWRLCTAWAFA
jgi:hypothetical protein